MYYAMYYFDKNNGQIQYLYYTNDTMRYINARFGIKYTNYWNESPSEFYKYEYIDAVNCTKEHMMDQSKYDDNGKWILSKKE